MAGDFHRAEILIAPIRGFSPVPIKELWAYRELLGFLVWRDVSVRYKQSLLGILWALLTPLIAMAIFTIIFGRLAEIPTAGIPYPIFSLVGLLPWLFFAQSLQRATLSMVAERNLITKVYFPRLIIPIAATLAPLFDLLIASSLVIVAMVHYQIVPSPHSLYSLPLCLLWAWIAAVGVGTWLAALNVYFRDVAQVIPFLIQVWMYASPVVYPASLIPAQYQWVYGLNPMVGVIEGFRWALLSQEQPPAELLLVSLAATLFIFAFGVLFFQRLERSFSDVV